MADAVGLVLGIPATVKGFIEVARALQKYGALEDDHNESINRAIFGSKMLEHYASLVDATKLVDVDNAFLLLLEEALTHSLEAHHAADNVVKEWSRKLGIEVEGKAQKQPSSPMFRISKMANSIVKTVCMSKEKSEGKSRRPIKKLLVDVEYLALGRIAIDEAVARMDRWIGNLGRVLLILPMHILVSSYSRVGDPSNQLDNHAIELAFVIRARERLGSDVTPRVIDSSQIHYAFSIDPALKCIVKRLKDGTHAGCILDLRNVAACIRAGQTPEAARNDTERICNMFAEGDDVDHSRFASIGILQCCGYMDSLDSQDQYLVFRLPPGAGTPRNLRSLLLDSKPKHALNMRLEFSIQLATSIFIVHSLGIVHKNIRPDSIIITEPITADRRERFPYRLGTPYLVSFGQARDDVGASGDWPYPGQILFDFLYRHPRHVVAPHSTRPRYEMRDDIYSLGVCLVEIAIWKSFFKWNPDMEVSNDFPGGFVQDTNVLKFSYDDPDLTEETEEYDVLVEQDLSWLRLLTLLALAESEVGVTMGEAFKGVVVDCLTFGSERSKFETLTKTRDLKKIEVKDQSTKFLRNILERLRSLSLS